MIQVPYSQSVSISQSVVNYIELKGKLTASFHLISWTSSSWVRCDSLPRLLIFLGSSFWYLEQRDLVSPELTERLAECDSEQYWAVPVIISDWLSEPVKCQLSSAHGSRPAAQPGRSCEWYEERRWCGVVRWCGVIVATWCQLTANQFIMTVQASHPSLPPSLPP